MRQLESVGGREPARKAGVPCERALSRQDADIRHLVPGGKLRLPSNRHVLGVGIPYRLLPIARA